MNYGKMRHADANNSQLGEFSARDIAVAGHFPYTLNYRFAAGITAKFLTSHIRDYNSIGARIDPDTTTTTPSTTGHSRL